MGPCLAASRYLQIVRLASSNTPQAAEAARWGYSLADAGRGATGKPGGGEPGWIRPS